jgi:hypothetical protein
MKKTIAQPLVRLNQIFISSSILLALGFNQLWILWIPLLANLSALLLNYHPVMALAKRFMPKDLSGYEQEDVADLRFNQTIVVSLLSSAILASGLGYPIVALALSIMVVTACVIALLGFCIGCYIRYHINMWMYRMKSNQN